MQEEQSLATTILFNMICFALKGDGRLALVGEGEDHGCLATFCCFAMGFGIWFFIVLF